MAERQQNDDVILINYYDVMSIEADQPDAWLKVREVPKPSSRLEVNLFELETGESTTSWRLTTLTEPYNNKIHKEQRDSHLLK